MDYFFAHRRCDLVKVTIPNENEKVAYKYNQNQMKGLIFFVTKRCDWGKCEEGELTPDEIAKNSHLNIKINGKPIQSIKRVGDALLLKPENGLYWEASSDDDYEVSFEVVKFGDSYLRLSSFIIY